MTIDRDAFIFEPRAVPRDGHIARVRENVGSRAALFAGLAEALKFPENFGHNWDALEGCLRDLSWIPEKTVALVHEHLPGLPRKELVTYLEILSDAVNGWTAGEAHELLVFFPPEARKPVMALTPKKKRR
jgi:hypothetical protein